MPPRDHCGFSSVFLSTRDRWNGPCRKKFTLNSGYKKTETHIQYVQRQQALVPDSPFKGIPVVKLHSTFIITAASENNYRLRKVRTPSYDVAPKERRSESWLQESRQ